MGPRRSDAKGGSGSARYDSIAERYDELAVPVLFVAPARDLVAALRLQASEDVLDVGCGTGAATLPALAAVAPDGRVVGLDRSRGMLEIARRNGVAHAVAGAVPGLPFPGGTFHAVMASFVLAHVPDYIGALRDMARALCRGGRLGVSAWGRFESEAIAVWEEVADAFAPIEPLRQEIGTALPWEDRLSDPAVLEDALREAGLIDVRVTAHRYTSSMDLSDFVTMREISIWGRLLRERLDAASWDRFSDRLRETLVARFPDRLDYPRSAYIAVGSRR